MSVNVSTVAVWLPVIQQLVALGCTSYTAIRAIMQDAGADDTTIEAMRPKWAALTADVRRAAGLPPMA